MNSSTEFNLTLVCPFNPLLMGFTSFLVEKQYTNTPKELSQKQFFVFA